MISGKLQLLVKEGEGLTIEFKELKIIKVLLLMI